jgi:hypothetical protein
MGVERGTSMRRTSHASHGNATSVEPTEADEMSGRVLGIISAYRMGAVVEARDLCQKPVPEPVPEPTPRPAEGYIRNGVYHVGDRISAPRS